MTNTVLVQKGGGFPYETKAGKKIRKLTKFNEVDGKKCEDIIPTIVTIITKGRTTIDSRLKAYRCELCGYEGKDRKYEVHHVNKVKNLKGKEPWEVVMLAKRRKTLVVCQATGNLISTPTGVYPDKEVIYGGKQEPKNPDRD